MARLEKYPYKSYCKWDDLRKDKRIELFLEQNQIITSCTLIEKVDPILSVLTGKNMSFYVPRYDIYVTMPLESFCNLWKMFEFFFHSAYGSINPWLSKKEIYTIFGHNQKIYNFFNMARSYIMRCSSSLEVAICLLQVKANGIRKGYASDECVNYDMILHTFVKKHPEASIRDIFYEGIRLGMMNI